MVTTTTEQQRQEAVSYLLELKESVDGGYLSKAQAIAVWDFMQVMAEEEYQEGKRQATPKGSIH